jgi:hypothetical protein
MDNLEPEDELASPAERAAVALIVLCACTVAWITAFVALKSLLQ